MMLMSGKQEQKFEIIHATLAHDNNVLSISELCRVAGVSRSGYYHWVGAKSSREAREAQDKADFESILLAYNMWGKSKGARGIHMTLLHFNPPIVMNVKKIGRIMRKFHLACPVRRPNPYRARALEFQESAVASYILNRRFRLFGPRSVLLTDITYLIYADGRKCYMSVVIDAYTKQALSHVVSRSLEEDFVLETINNLARDHGVSLSTETLINSDQGSHYTCVKFSKLIKDIGLRQSMSRKATCWDNAPQESFFGHIKDEIDLRACASFEQVKRAIDEEIDYYNNWRYQWALAKLSPNEFCRYAMTGVYPLPVPPPKEFQNNPPLCRSQPIPLPESLAEQVLQSDHATHASLSDAATPAASVYNQSQEALLPAKVSYLELLHFPASSDAERQGALPPGTPEV